MNTNKRQYVTYKYSLKYLAILAENLRTFNTYIKCLRIRFPEL